MFRFIHAADIHLDSPLRGLERYEGAPVEQIRGATRQAFDNLVELAMEEQVAFVLLAGDLYDGDWRDYNTGLFFVDRMVRLREAGIRVYVIAGNHDAASQISRALRLPDNVHRFATRKPESLVLDDLGVAIHGQGFASRSVTEDLSAGYPQGDPQLLNIGLLHTALNGRQGHEPYAPCSLDGLRSKGYQYWALGHVHAREEIARDPWIVFPGNLQGRHVRETGAKGCTLVTVEEGRIGAVDHRALDVLRWALCTVDVSGAADTDEVYDRVRGGLEAALRASDGRPVAARLVLVGSCAAHGRLHAESAHWIQEYRALATSLGGEGLWVEKVVLDTGRSFSLDAALAREDALGGLLRSIRDLEYDGPALTGLRGAMDTLRQRLPPELLADDDPFAPGNLLAALEDVKELLLSELMRAGGQP